MCTPGGRVNRGDLAEHMCLYSLCITVHSTTLNSCFRSKKKKKILSKEENLGFQESELSPVFFFFFKSSPEVMFIDFGETGREREREREEH